MRRLVTVLSLLLVAALLWFFVPLRAALPNDAGPLIRAKYDSWSGVLRLWVYEGWEANAMAWLNSAISAFEKGHDGVYIQARKVDAEALRAFADSGISPPDMILFPPGLLDSADGLAEVGGLPALRAGLAGCADGYAVPVLMGGYAWAFDRQALEGAPAEGDAIACASAGEHSSPPAALMLLSTGEREAEVEIEAPGLDLGLPVGAAVREGTTVLSEDAYGAFTRGDVDALVATQADIRRLTALSEAGTRPGLGGSGHGRGDVSRPAAFAGHRRLAAHGHRRAAGALPGVSPASSQHRDAGGARHMRRTTRAGGLGAVWRQKRL